jgi:fucose permease
MLAAGTLAGAGGGMIDSLTNAVFLDLTAGDPKAAGSLNMLHAYFGVGALLEPAIAGLLLGHGVSWRAAFAVVAVIAATLTVAALPVRFPPAAHAEAAPAPEAPHARYPLEGHNRTSGSPEMRGHNRTSGATKVRGIPSRGVRSTVGSRPAAMVRLLTRPAFLLLGGTLAIYVAAELAVTDWLVTYMVRSHLTGVDVAAGVLSFYWFTLTLGRLLGTWVAARVDPYWLTGGSAALGALALAGTVAFPLAWSTVAFAGLTGLFFAVLFPTTFAIAGRIFARQAGTLSGGLMVVGMAGSTLGPWLIGQIGQQAGLRAPLFGTAAVMLLAVPMLVAVRRGADARAAQPERRATEALPRA